MAVRRKPKSSDLDTFIQEGGAAPKTQDTSKEVQVITLRVPTKMLADVDQAVSNKPIKISRHQWLLEAVLEKLNREKTDT